jgi:hypothetical protein
MIRWFKRMWNKIREEIRYRKRLKELHIQIAHGKDQTEVKRSIHKKSTI